MSEWFSLKDLTLYEERKGMDYVLLIGQKGSKELTPEEAYLLGNALTDWAIHIKPIGWEDTIEVVINGENSHIRSKIDGAKLRGEKKEERDA